MDRYQRVERPRAETPIDENEIRITSQGRMRNYITYAMSLIEEKGSNEIVFKAMGRAINKTVTIVELIKRRIVGLHQITSIGSTDITDTWEPLEEGLLPLETTRHVSMITITLSKQDLDTSNVGIVYGERNVAKFMGQKEYQPPLPADEVKAQEEYDYEGESSPRVLGRGRGRGGSGRGRGRGRSRGRGRGRGPPGNGYPSVEYDDGGWDQDQGQGQGPQGRGYYARGRGRGRGYGSRGRGTGGYNYNGPQFDTQEGPEGYSRGRGRGPLGRGRGGRGRGRSGARPVGPGHADAGES